MPKRTVLETIVLHRDGKRLVVSPQKPPVAFDFTADEVAQINKTNPHAFRKPIDESGSAIADTSGDAGKPAATDAGKVPAAPAAASNSSGVNSASGAADLANANKAPGDKPAGTSSDKVADL